MQVDGVSQSIPANSTVNVFQGRYPEFIGGAQPSVMRLLITADAEGCTVALNQNAGNTQISPVSAGTTVNTAAAAGDGPKDDEDTIVPAVVVPVNCRQALNVTNNTGAAIVIRYRAIIGP